MYVLTYAGSGNEVKIISGTCSTSNAITAVVSCAVSFIIATVIGVVVHYSVVRKKSKCQKLYSLIAACKQQKHQPAPVYEDVVGQSQRIEIKENVAYDPVQPWALILRVNVFHMQLSQCSCETGPICFASPQDVNHCFCQHYDLRSWCTTMHSVQDIISLPLLDWVAVVER